MRRYLINLLAAILGKDPYRAELERVREECRKIAEKAKSLEDIYDRMLAEKASQETLVSSYQKLIETQRQHLSDKNVLIEKIKGEYQERIARYNMEIDSLRKQIPAANPGNHSDCSSEASETNVGVD